MNYRPCIRLSLNAGGFLLFVLVVSTLLWLALLALGDAAWATGLLGVVLATLACSVVNFVWLVVCLALFVLASSEEEEE